MRSLKECYEIAKRYHAYWSGNPHDPEFMCLAAEDAYDDRTLSEDEYRAVKIDGMSLVKAINKEEFCLRTALGNPAHEEVKTFWDRYIDSMENQDG